MNCIFLKKFLTVIKFFHNMEKGYYKLLKNSRHPLPLLLKKNFFMHLFSKSVIDTDLICKQTFTCITRGPCPLLALLVNHRSQGLRPLQPMLAKSHLFLANIKQILIRFVYMRDQEKKWELQTFIWVLFHYTGPNLAKWTSLWKIRL